MGGYDIDPTLLSKMKVFIRKECVVMFCAWEGDGIHSHFHNANACQASYFKFENVEQGCARVVGVGWLKECTRWACEVVVEQHAYICQWVNFF
jgi:hypothetical protein